VCLRREAAQLQHHHSNGEEFYVLFLLTDPPPPLQMQSLFYRSSVGAEQQSESVSGVQVRARDLALRFDSFSIRVAPGALEHAF
jgi:hypothetical protein